MSTAYLPIVFMTQRRVNALLEYQTSVPTGAYPGKLFRRTGLIAPKPDPDSIWPWLWHWKWARRLFRWRYPVTARHVIGAFYTRADDPRRTVTLAWYRVEVVQRTHEESPWVHEWTGWGEPHISSPIAGADQAPLWVDQGPGTGLTERTEDWMSRSND